MKRKTQHLFVLSFDGLSTLDFEYISTLPNFNEFIKGASYCKKVYSVYPTLTYPAHATIVTGKYPKHHGVINNTLLQPNRRSPDWYWYRKYVKGETLYDKAIDNGMKVAALLWPVTAKSRIQYNLPEIFSNRWWNNQVLVSLLSGSPLFQIQLAKKFGSLLEGIKQPNLDNFTHQALLYTIEKKKPDMALVHYVDLDGMRHMHGFNSKEAKEALNRHDKRLGEIIETLKKNNMYEESTIVVLGDHSSLDEDKIIYLNVFLKEKGYIKTDEKGKIIDYKAIAKSCDGSAYLYVKDKNNKELASEVGSLIEKFNTEFKCIEAIYTREEAINMGADPECTFILEAAKGYYFLNGIDGEVIQQITSDEGEQVHELTKATHGYSPYKKDYTTVFMASGKGIKKGVSIDEMNLVDEGPTMAKLLGFELTEIDGRVVEEFLE